MATPVADRALLDTNVLLAATDEARVDHEDAITAINVWPASGVVLYTSGQILREYLAVATRPTDHNGLGMTQRDAVANVRALRARLRLLAEDAKVGERLLELLAAVECAGKQVHDANVVATMLVHGIDTVVTLNAEDFARFGHQVHVVGLRP
ncbi:MAG: type II toxin-antitoxin system VapC family toxin [Solirubrobacteraceae bacterium]